MGAGNSGLGASLISASSSNGKWVETKDLKSGDRLLAANGDIVTVEDIAYEAGQVKVYNFEVEDNHTYFVGELGVLVHNDSGYLSTDKNPELDLTKTSQFTEKQKKAMLELDPLIKDLKKITIDPTDPEKVKNLKLAEKKRLMGLIDQNIAVLNNEHDLKIKNEQESFLGAIKRGTKTYAERVLMLEAINAYPDGYKGYKDSEISIAGDFVRRYLPGILGAPLGGLFDSLTGIANTIVGAATLDTTKTLNALKQTGLGLLNIVGAHQILTETKITAKPGRLELPESLVKAYKEANTDEDSDIHGRDAANGMHGWHGASHAVVASQLGIFSLPFSLLGGIAHEIDTFPSEIRQGKVNWALDSLGDIAANTLGAIGGLFVPPPVAPYVGRWLGSLVPGPGDHDPHGHGNVRPTYDGNPSKAWIPKLRNK